MRWHCVGLVAALLAASPASGQGCNGGSYRGAPYSQGYGFAPPGGYGYMPEYDAEDYGAGAAPRFAPPPDVTEFRSGPDGNFFRYERPSRQYEESWVRGGGGPRRFALPPTVYYAAAPRFRPPRFRERRLTVTFGAARGYCPQCR